MRTSTIENIRRRCYWLQSVWDKQILLPEAHHSKLADMKAFCTLEIPNEFGKISYNTLKTFTSNNNLPEINNATTSLWEHMRALRAKIYSVIKPPQVRVADQKPTPTVMINEAYNQAQLATYAYLDLFRFIKTLVESDASINDSVKLLINNFLFESNLKFEKICTAPASPPRIWSVIQGGKGDV